MAIVTIQHRRGNYGDFDKQKMLPGEMAWVLKDDPNLPSGKAVYVAYAAGDVERLISVEQLDILIQQDRFKGEKGDKGDPGKDAPKVSGADIDDQGHLIITMDDGTEYDAGPLDEAFALIQQAVTSSDEAATSAQEAKTAAEQTATDRAAAETAKEEAQTAASEAASSETAAAESAETASTAAQTATEQSTAAETAKTAAETAAGNAKQSETNAEKAKTDAQTAAQTATEKATAAEKSATDANADKLAADAAKSDAEKWAKTSQSYANGESGSREGEESDNAKEYARQAKESADRAAEIAGGDVLVRSDKGAPGGVAELGEDGKVPLEQLPDLAPHTVSTPVILKSSKWHNDASPYTYNIDIDGLRADQFVQAYNAMGVTKDEIKSFWQACITALSQEEGKIVFQALEKPEMDLPIVLELEEGQEVLKYSRTLADNTWDEIMEAGETPGLSATLWKVGDEKELDLGVEGKVHMQIAGFGVDELADGSGNAEVTWISKELLKNYRQMNPEIVKNDDETYKEGTGSIGGWGSSKLRTELKEQILLLFADVIKTHLKNVKKQQSSTTTKGGSELQITSDDLWIPGNNEIGGTYGKYTALFPDVDSRIKHRFGTETACCWWNRDAYGTAKNDKFRIIGVSGVDSDSQAFDIRSIGVCLCFCTGSKNPVPIGNCTDISAEGGDTTVTLKWTDPPDTEESVWAGTKVVRKLNSYPESVDDGTLVVDSTTRDQYKDTGYEDTELTNGTTYYYALFPYTDKVVTIDPANRVEATPKGFADMTWAEIDAAVTDGSYKTRFKLHDTKDLVLGGDYAETIPVEIAGFDHDDLVGGGGKAGLTFIAKVLLKDSQMMKSQYSDPIGYEASALRTLLNGAIYEAFPEDLKPLIQMVNKISDGGINNPIEITTEDKVWIPSYHEVGFTEVNQYVIGQQGAQYDIFADNKSRKRSKKDASSSDRWSLRSLYGDNNIWCVEPTGDSGFVSIRSSIGVLLCFCIGKSPN